MTESSNIPLSELARQLLGDSDEPDHRVTCAWCGKMTTCPGFIWAAVRTWNRQEGELAIANDRKAHFITGRDMGVCCEGDCTKLSFDQKHKESEQETWTTEVYLRDLRAGRYNPQTLQWLRERGYGDRVRKVMNEEGNKSHG